MQDPKIELERVLRKVAAAKKKRTEILDVLKLRKIGDEDIQKALAINYVALTTNLYTYQQWRPSHKISREFFDKIKVLTGEELTDELKTGLMEIEQPHLILFASWKYVEEEHPEMVKALLDKAAHIYYTRHQLPIAAGGYIVAWRNKKTANPTSYGRSFSVRLDQETADKLVHITEKVLPAYSTTSDTLRFLVDEYKFSN